MPPRITGIRTARDVFWYEDQAARVFAPEPCPRCGEEQNIWPETVIVPYGLYCRGCQWGGPREADDDAEPDAALWAWNDEARKIREARALGLQVSFDQAPEEDCHG